VNDLFWNLTFVLCLSLSIAQPTICSRQCKIYTILLTFILVFICMISIPSFSMINFCSWLPPCSKNIVSLFQFFTILLQDDEKFLESYAKSWTSGVLDKASQRDSMAFTLAKHHLSGFVFQSSDSGKTLRNKLVKSLIRCYAQKRHHEVIARSCFFECLGLCNSFHV